MSVANILDTVVQGASAAPLPPQAKIALALGNTQNQEAARKGANTIQAVIFGVAAVISLLIAIGLLVAAGKSDIPHVKDGKWYGGWSILFLAVIPLSILTGYTVYRNESCKGDIVAALANTAPGNVGRAAQAYQQL